MKIHRSMFVVAALSVAVLIAPAFAAPRPGTPAPDFTAKDVNGNTIKLSDFKGKTVVIDWANYQCPFDKMHYESGNIPALQKKYTAQGVVWLTVHSSAPGREGYHDPAELKKEDDRVKNAATHVIPDPDGKIGHLFEAKTTPHIYVINSKGIIQYNGAIDSVPSTDAKTLATATPYAKNAIASVLSGGTPELTSTQPYGCSVKY